MTILPVRAAKIFAPSLLAATSATTGPASEPSAPAAIEHRIPWTGSKLVGTPDPPPPYTVEPAFPHLKFGFPVVLVSARGTRRLFVGELRGRVYSFADDRDAKKADLRSTSPGSMPTLRALWSGISPRLRQNSLCLYLLCQKKRHAGWLARLAIHGEPVRSTGD